MRNLIYIIIVILVISWLFGGFALHLGGNAIHIIIVIAVVLLIYNLFVGNGRRWGRRSGW